MKTVFVQIKCELGKAYAVGESLVGGEIATEVYSTAGDYDLLVRFFIADETDIGHFITETVQRMPGVKDTHTIVTFRSF